MLLRVDGEPVEFWAVRSGGLFAAANEAIAGRLAVSSTAGAGTTLRAEMPCA